jgi:hypothetical protein
MFAPRSKKSMTVQQKASPGCRIWFVCKGNLVCTRYALGTWLILYKCKRLTYQLYVCKI